MTRYMSVDELIARLERAKLNGTDGATAVVAQTEGGPAYVTGGFAESHWDGDGSHTFWLHLDPA